MQLLHNGYFEVLVDHKAIKYMIKSKTESPTTRLKTLLLKLSEYTIDLKYQKGSEMHTSDALTLPSLAGVAALKSLITLYINICKITFFPSTQFAYIYMLSYLYVSCVKG